MHTSAKATTADAYNSEKKTSIEESESSPNRSAAFLLENIIKIRPPAAVASRGGRVNI